MNHSGMDPLAERRWSARRPTMLKSMVSAMVIISSTAKISVRSTLCHTLDGEP